MSYYAFSSYAPERNPVCSRPPYCREAPVLQPYDLTRAYGESPEECALTYKQYDENTDSCFTEQVGPLWGKPDCGEGNYWSDEAQNCFSYHPSSYHPWTEESAQMAARRQKSEGGIMVGGVAALLLLLLL